MGMTIAEKILARASGRDRVSPGDVVTVNVDTVILFDHNFILHDWREVLAVKDPERIIVVFDHRVPAPTQMAAAAHATGRAFVKKFGVKRFHDLGQQQGISHQLVADHGYALPGSVLVCSDSHTCSAGVFNCLARGVGTPDIIYTTTKGETWYRCGETVRYELDGILPVGVFTKDVFLHIAGEYGDHAGQNVEYGGRGIAALSMNARKTIATMSAELSAEFATFDPDPIMLDWVRARNSLPFVPVYPDAAARYRDVRQVDLAAMQPLLGFPDSVIRNSGAVRDAAGTAIDQAFIGSCANGTIDDLECAAQILRGRQVAAGVRLLITPASQTTYREALKRGLLEILTDAGAVVTSPTCGACGGAHMGVIGPNEVCVTASTRNFKGRMGDPSARIFMGSPATVAASAVRGVITDPREFLQ